MSIHHRSHLPDKQAAQSNYAAQFTLHIMWGILLVPALILLFSWIARGVMADRFIELDRAATDWLRQFATPQLTGIVKILTHLATSYIIAPLALISAAWIGFTLRLTNHALMLLTTLAGSTVLNGAMKAWLQRARPQWEHWTHASGYSFPSGHTMAAVSFYGMLAYLLYRILRSKHLPTWYIPASAVLLILTIGLSRVYLGVHYFTDVLGGFMAGGIWLLACMYTLSWMCKDTNRDAQR